MTDRPARTTPQGVVFIPAFGRACSNVEIATVARCVTARFGSDPAILTESDVAL